MTGFNPRPQEYVQVAEQAGPTQFLSHTSSAPAGVKSAAEPARAAATVNTWAICILGAPMNCLFDEGANAAVAVLFLGSA
jgi:hypothetical protein